MDCRAFNIALKACHTPGKTLRQEQLVQAFAIYDQLKRSGLQPDAFTFSTLFSLCAEARQGHCALQASRRRRCDPLCNTAAVRCGCTALFKGLQSPLYHPAPVSHSVCVCVPARLPACLPACLLAWLQLYSEMRELGVQENVVAMTALLKAVGSTPGPDMAQECSRLFKRMSRGPSRWVGAAAWYCTWSSGYQPQQAGKPCSALNCMQWGEGQGAKPSRARCSLTPAHPRHAHIGSLPRRRCKPNQATFRTVVGALREQGALAEALRAYQAMRRLYPADNSEFEGLTAVAAERALAAEDAELRLAVAEVCNITSCQEVDLHGLSALEARAAVLCVLAMLQQQCRDTGAICHDVTIITGRGLGSAGGEPVVRNEVARLLERLNLRLPPEAMSANPGRIVIPQQVVYEAMHARQLKSRRSSTSGTSSTPAGASGGGNSDSTTTSSSSQPEPQQ